MDSFRSGFVLINRRLFLRRLGRGTLAVAVLGSCGDSPVASNFSGASTTSGASDSSPATTAGSNAAQPSPTSASATVFHRVHLGFVSAYLVVRGSEAAVVDTGVSGSGGAIASALGEVGLDWTAVAYVILTHHHPDHVGSLGEVLETATGAAAYAGTEDIPSINSPRELSPVVDGDNVFGLRVITTPGHTPGHISMLDESASVLVAGDAINGVDGGVSGPNPRFTDDMTIANQSVEKMAGLSFDTVYFGHGEPVMVGASAFVADLAARL
jgi:glyoxylase-like metal-dependent hydrolase (beta-lactamase superfamily II)